MIDPVVVDVTIQREPEKAFELFTSRIADWWPLDTHSLGAADKKLPATVVMEPHEGGRIYEVSDDGIERIWGSVTDWRPGDHVAFTWHVGRAPRMPPRYQSSFGRPTPAVLTSHSPMTTGMLSAMKPSPCAINIQVAGQAFSTTISCHSSKPHRSDRPFTKGRSLLAQSQSAVMRWPVKRT